MDKKIEKFNHTCGTIRRTLNGKLRRVNLLKCYKVMAVPVSYTHLDVYKRQPWIRLCFVGETDVEKK